VRRRRGDVGGGAAARKLLAQADAVRRAADAIAEEAFIRRVSRIVGDSASRTRDRW
jgi:hypothetical protein